MTIGANVLTAVSHFPMLGGDGALRFLSLHVFVSKRKLSPLAEGLGYQIDFILVVGFALPVGIFRAQLVVAMIEAMACATKTDKIFKSVITTVADWADVVNVQCLAAFTANLTGPFCARVDYRAPRLPIRGIARPIGVNEVKRAQEVWVFSEEGHRFLNRTKFCKPLGKHVVTLLVNLPAVF